jgi:uncharacterized protein (DUF488 family)
MSYTGRLDRPAPEGEAPDRHAAGGGQPLFTVGHSTRSIDELLEILRAHEVQHLVDVRRFPGSRRHPHFGREALAATLTAAGIAYDWVPDLGGRRSRPKGSPPSAWRVPAFAAYADYMDTPEFRQAAEALLTAAQQSRTVIMCAEAVPYQCHRRLISDWIVLHGAPVVHLRDARRREDHRVTEFARLDGDRVRYDTGTQLDLSAT